MSEDRPHTTPAEKDPESTGEEELASLHERMDEIRQELADEVDTKWSSTWRSPEMFEVKVSARLSAHEEYQGLLARVRQGREDGERKADGDDTG